MNNSLIYNSIQSCYRIRSYLNEYNLELKYTILKVNNHWRELYFQLLFDIKIKYTILNILTELLRFYRSISRKGVLFYFGKKCQFIKTSFRDRKIDFIGHSPEKMAIRFLVIRLPGVHQIHDNQIFASKLMLYF